MNEPDSTYVRRSARRAGTCAWSAAASDTAPVVISTPTTIGGRADGGRYEWTLANTAKHDGYTAYILRLTSQTWLTPDSVDVTVWTRTSSARR